MSNYLPIELKSCKTMRGFAYGFLQPVIIGHLSLDQAISIPINKLDAMMQMLFKQLGPLSSTIPDKPKDILGFCKWILDWSHLLQRSRRIPVQQPPKIVTNTIGNGKLHVVFATPYHDEVLSLASLKWIVQTMQQLLLNKEATEKISFQIAAKSFKALIDQMNHKGVVGVNIDRMLKSAVENRIPFIYMGMNTYLVGQGENSSWIQSTFTDATSHLGAIFARNKLAAGNILRFHGLPTANQKRVRSLADAVCAAEKIGYPVVVKAADLDGGVGVHAGLYTSKQVERCYSEAYQHSKNIMVEGFQIGSDYRLTVIHGEVVKIVQRIPGGVTGDGRHTVAELLKSALQEDQHKRRMSERGKVLLKIDDESIELLDQLGLKPDSILPEGKFVSLRRRANVSTGGSTISIRLEDAHPDNCILAVRAATALRLDLAGIDLILPNIRQSWIKTGGIICEVNGQPQVGENGSPGLYLRFFKTLLGGDGRIPIAMIICATPVQESQVRRWREAFAEGLAGDALIFDGKLFINGMLVSTQQKTSFEQACAALASREVGRALIVLSLEELAAQGLPVQQVDRTVLIAPIDVSQETAALIKNVSTAIEQHTTDTISVSHDQEGETWLKSLLFTS